MRGKPSEGSDPFTALATDDADRDGMPHLMEYAFGGNPLVSDATQKTPRGATTDIDGQRYLTLTFDRRRQPGSLRYLLEESTNLVSWTQVELNSRLVGTPVILDADRETVTVRGGQALNAVGAPKRDFLRIRLNNSP